MARSREINKEKDARKRGRHGLISNAELVSLGVLPKAAQAKAIVAPTFSYQSVAHEDKPKPTIQDDVGITPEFMETDITPVDEYASFELPDVTAGDYIFNDYYGNSAYTFESLGILPMLPDWFELPSVNLFDLEEVLPKVSTENELLTRPEKAEKATSPLANHAMFAAESRTRSAAKIKSIEKTSREAEEYLERASVRSSTRFKKKK